MKTEPRFSAWAALPDGISAAMFLAVWLHPFIFGALSVKTAMLTMLLEFFLIHATGFFTALGGNDRVAPKLRVLGLVGLSLFYVLMIGGVAWSFGEWWPLLAFAWLVVGKVMWARGGDTGHDATMLKMAAWAGSVVAYLFAALVTVMMPVPRLGMREELQPGFGFSENSGGLWIEQPQTVVAMGALYFALLCVAKLLAARWESRKSGGGKNEAPDRPGLRD